MKNMKRIVCFLLILSLLGVSIPSGTAEAATSVENATEGFTLDDLGTDYTVVTPENFGITGETSYDADTQLPVNSDSGATSWNKTVFHGRVKFTGNTGHRLYFGVNTWAGLFISGNADGDLAYETVAQGDANSGTITLENTKLTDQWLDFAVSIEIVTAGDAGSIKVGFFIDKKLCNNQFITMSNVATAHFSSACKLFLSGNGGSTLSIAPLLAEEEPTEPTELTPLTFSSFGYDDTDITGWIGKEGNSGVNFENIVFNGYMTFKGECTRYMLVGNGWNGLKFKFTSTTIEVQASSVGGSTWNIYPRDIKEDMSSFSDVRLRFTFSLEKTNETDAILKVAINGISATLGGAESQVLTDAYSTSGNLQNIALYFSDTTTDYPITIASYVEGSDVEEEPVAEEHLRKLTLDSFGIASGTISAEAGKTVDALATTSPVSSLMNTTMTMKIVNTGSQCNIHYATPESTYHQGLRIEILEGAMRFVAVGNDGNQIMAGYMYPAANKPAKGEEFTLGIELTKVAAGADGENNDVCVRIYFNGNEAFLSGTEEAVVLEDVANTLGNRMAIVANPSASETAGSITVSNPQEDASQFETLTLDEIGQTAGVYRYTGSWNVQAGVNWSGSLNGKIFKTNVRFNSMHSQIFYGAPSAGSWAGIQIGTQQPGNYEQEKVFSVVYPSAPFSFTSILDAGIAGVQLTNNTYELGISTREVDSNGDDVFDDLEIGIWFNGKLYNNSYTYLTSCEDSSGTYKAAKDILGPSMAVMCRSEKGEVVLGDVAHEEDVVCSIDEYAYFVDSDSQVTVTIDEGSTEYNSSYTLTKPGKYTVKYTDGASTFTKNLTLYRTNDATEDGEVNIQDLVALLRYEADASERPLGEAGVEAITPADVETTAYGNMIAALLADDNVIQAKQLPTSVISTSEAMGNGKYITSLGTSTEGTSVIGISDTAANYQTDAQKFDGTGLDFVLDFDTERPIKVLQLTDTQIMTPAKTSKGFENVEDWEGNLKAEVDKLIADNQPDLILLTGDITYGVFDDDEGTMLKAVVHLMESYKIPWAPILGNHEQETTLGTAWMCEQFVNAPYCLFNRRHEVGGNGNYSIGLAVNGELQRTIFMLDSRLCYSGLSDEFASGEASRYAGFTDEQFAWYRTVVAKVNACAGEELKSLMCFHIPAAEMATACMENGYQPAADSSRVTYAYDLGTTPNENGDFGFKNSKISGSGSSMCDYIYTHLLAGGTDGVFSGHQHLNNLSINWKGIRWTFGLKTGAYESNPSQTGGTLITINTDSTFEVEHKPITERTAD